MLSSAIQWINHSPVDKYLGETNGKRLFYMYPPDSVVYLLKSGLGVDQLPNVSTVMSPKNISAKQTCLQWTCTSFSPPKPLPLLLSPPLSACLHINCDMQLAKGHA